MNSISKFGAVLLTGMMALGAAGCSTMDSAYQGSAGMTNPDKTTLKAQLKWMNPQPNLRTPATPDKRVVYVRIRNSSGSPMDMNYVNAQVKGSFERQNYRVTLNPSEAFFIVQGDIRFFGDAATKDGTAGTIGGAIVGGAAGAVAGHAIGGNRTGTVIGGAAGALLVGWLMDVMAERNKMVEYDLVIDLRIGERTSAAVRTQRRANEGAEVGHSASFNAAGGSAEYGSSSAESGETQQVDTQDDFFYHKNTASAAAVKMRLTPEEAFPVLAQKIATSLGEVLP